MEKQREKKIRELIKNKEKTIKTIALIAYIIFLIFIGRFLYNNIKYDPYYNQEIDNQSYIYINNIAKKYNKNKNISRLIQKSLQDDKITYEEYNNIINAVNNIKSKNVKKEIIRNLNN